MSSYWTNEVANLDHHDLALMAARIFALPLSQVAFCTTASLRKAIATCNKSALSVRVTVVMIFAFVKFVAVVGEVLETMMERE
jgi:hypothetical protein